jgi:CubicO group peptidase (beta-lactamase class C family)
MKIFLLIFAIAMTLIFGHYPRLNGQDGAVDPHPVDRWIANFYGSDLEPGLALMVIEDGDVIFQRTSGIASLKTGDVLTPQSNFRLASVTKHMTALSVLMLSDWGKLNLDAPLTDYFPGLPEFGASISPRMLIHHTSGLIDHDTLGHLLDPKRVDRLASGQEQLLDSDVLALIEKTDKTYFKPGTEFRYSNTGYALLALLVEKTSGVSFPLFLKENVFAPLGMKNTLVYAHDAIEVKSRVYGHSKTEKGWALTDQNYSSAILGDGGVYCSLEDLQQWFKFLDGKKKLNMSDRAFDEYFSPGTWGDGSMIKLPTKKKPALASPRNTIFLPESYGFGWTLGKHEGTRIHFHGGASIGFRHMLLRQSKSRLYIVLLTNRNKVDKEFVEPVFGHFLAIRRKDKNETGIPD